MSSRPVRRALISTADKTGIVEFAKALIGYGIEIIATDGTAKLLQQHHVPHITVSDVTGFPEILDGRVKTLHPAIHAGILSRRTNEDDLILTQHNINTIDLLVVNLYPFEKTQAIEQIDVGGPSLLRAAAKNFAHVTTVTHPTDYAVVLHEMALHNGTTTVETRRQLAIKVFKRLAEYNEIIAQALSKTPTIKVLRYGENPHQSAALHITEPHGLANCEQLHGKELSYNNYVDADSAFKCVTSFDATACVIVKHATPCGIALAKTNLMAYQNAFACDSQSAFGGVVAFNSTLDEACAAYLIENQFVEVVIAPDFSPNALTLLQTKKNVRILKIPSCPQSSSIRTISGGRLIQDADTKRINKNDLQIVTQRTPSATETQDLLFAWNAVRFVKSNAIVYAKDQRTLGIGSGQTSRIFAAEIAALKAKHANLSLTSAVMASDAFFPFADSVELAANLGITAIIQPGGSKRDPEVIKTANHFDIAMVFTHHRCFLH